MRTFSSIVAAGCFALAALCLIVQFLPAGPAGVISRSVQAAALVSGFVVGYRWIWRPWPRYESAVAFVVWADAAVAAVAVTMSTAEARLCTTLYLGVIGVFIGFLLGARLLVLHCAFGAAVIVGITVAAVLQQHAGLLDLFVIYMPALMWVVVVPLCGAVLIDSGRRAIVRVARSADHDQLTGLRNRRGLHAAVQRAVARTRPVNLVVSVCDIDRFKQLNDDRGHAAGDAALIALAQALRSVAHPDEVAARIGGDELVLVTFTEDRGEVPTLLGRLTSLNHVEVDGTELSVSVGIASMAATTEHFSLDDLIRRADAAMYEVKRSGGGRCGVHQ